MPDLTDYRAACITLSVSSLNWVTENLPSAKGVRLDRMNAVMLLASVKHRRTN